MTDRREHVSFDPRFFEKLEPTRRPSTLAETFDRIYRTNHWLGKESVSGEGSHEAQTGRLAGVLPRLCEQLRIDVLLDCPCGDLSWMRHVRLPVTTYIGADIVGELVIQNRRRYGSARRRFIRLDLTSDALPDADLLLCRDGLVHLSYGDIDRALRNLHRSKISYLLATTFPETAENEDIRTGDWRPLNLELPPFSWPAPESMINEGCTEAGGLFADKSLGLWHIADLPGRVDYERDPG